MTERNTKKLQTFVNKCLRNIMKIRWPETITNDLLWNHTNQLPIDREIRKRKWGWIGHTLRKPSANITRQALSWNPQGNWKVGRPKQTWRRSTDQEIREAGMSWDQLKKTSSNHVRWRRLLRSYVPEGIQRHKSSKSFLLNASLAQLFVRYC